MENPIVKVERLYHRYTASRWAIEDINFQISEAGVVGLLGSNGAGKSTTMNIICGVLKQTSGEVYINGINTLKEPVKARKMIGFLPQKPPLYPDLTINEYLRFCAEIQWMDKKKIKSAIARAEERCGITHMKDRLLRNLSGGYQQRVGIAQAIIHNPDFIILDEPTNGLDPNQIVEIRHLIKEIAEERTVILSTHILPEVQATCDYIRMIEQGNMVFSGTVEEFDNYIQPNTLVVSLGAAPLVADIQELPGVVRVEELGGPRFRIQFSDVKEAMNSIVEASYTRDWQLMELQQEKSSLDTIFAELSKK